VSEDARHDAYATHWNKISNDTLQMSRYICCQFIVVFMLHRSRHVGVAIETVHPGILQGPELFFN
jgi:hypothetical protein